MWDVNLYKSCNIPCWICWGAQPPFPGYLQPYFPTNLEARNALDQEERQRERATTLEAAIAVDGGADKSSHTSLREWPETWRDVAALLRKES